MSARPSRAHSHNASARKPDLKVVRRRGRTLIKRSGSRRTAPLLIVGVIALGAIVVGVLLEQVVLAQSAFKLETINSRLSAAETKQEELLAVMAQLESPGRIEKYARDRLGMIEPTSVEYIVAKVRMSTSNRIAAALEARNLPLPGSGTATATLRDGANP